MRSRAISTAKLVAVRATECHPITCTKGLLLVKCDIKAYLNNSRCGIGVFHQVYFHWICGREEYNALS